jgi:hypothetical protein
VQRENYTVQRVLARVTNGVHRNNFSSIAVRPPDSFFFVYSPCKSERFTNTCLVLQYLIIFLQWCDAIHGGHGKRSDNKASYLDRMHAASIRSRGERIIQQHHRVKILGLKVRALYKLCIVEMMSCKLTPVLVLISSKEIDSSECPSVLCDVTKAKRCHGGKMVQPPQREVGDWSTRRLASLRQHIRQHPIAPTSKKMTRLVAKWR